MKFKTLLVLSTLALSTAAYSHDNGRQEFNRRFVRDVQTKIRNFRARQDIIQKFRNLFKPKNLTTVACGDVITNSITIANDLNCPDATGYALQVIGSNITVNANGKKIVAPNAAGGLYVEGDNITIANFDVQGVTNGFGMIGYNTSGIKILSNNFSKNMTGIMLYADEEVKNPIIMSNKAISNSFAGIETFSDEPGVVVNPIITLNDFRSSGQFAMYLKADNALVQGSNLISGSASGFYLTGGDFKVQDISLANQLVQKRAFMVDSVSSIQFQDVDLTSLAPATADQDRIAIDMYRVAKFSLDDVTVKKFDVALKVASDEEVETQGVIKDSQFSQQTFADLYAVSWGQSPLGKIVISNTSFKNSANGIVVAEGTDLEIIQQKSSPCRW